jgi:transcriptional regulator with XRE-family HTH domain
MNAMERVQRRLALLLDERTPTGRLRHKALAAHLGKTEAWLSNILHSRRGVRLIDLDKIADFFRLPPSELIRAADAELVEVTPTEKALLRKYRQCDAEMQFAVKKMLGMPAIFPIVHTEVVKTRRRKKRVDTDEPQ